MADKTWVDAIQIVLQDAGSALHYTEIAKRIVEKSLRKSIGATPAQTVAATLAAYKKKENSPFVWVKSGEYALKEFLESSKTQESAVPQDTPDEEPQGLLAAFGMLWSRDAVLWDGSGKLWGRAELGEAKIDFSKQSGVYVLHDRQRVIYVGQANKTLFVRLKAHTTDRLSGRWDRFSWFGLRQVTDTGDLYDIPVTGEQSIILDTLEALLIECLEPPLNRKRGDKLAALEYLQAHDPEIEKRRKLKLIDEMKASIVS